MVPLCLGKGVTYVDRTPRKITLGVQTRGTRDIVMHVLDIYSVFFMIDVETVEISLNSTFPTLF